MVQETMTQVADDPALLSEMMDDLRAGDERYRPTNYWTYYQKRFLPELHKYGLKNFRRRKNSVLNAFAATDRMYRPRVKLKRLFRGSERISRIIDKIMFGRNPVLDLFVPDLPLGSITSWLHGYARRRFDLIGLNLAGCPTSQYGNPEDSTAINGKPWSTMHLQYCVIFADAARFIRFKPDSVICELGTGMGRNIEVMAHLFDNATFLMFDIPPQLYVAHQYLQKVFGSRVIGYREAKALQPDSPGAMEYIRGKIVMLPTWRMPSWASTKIDIFWNCASFQEMEPDVVANYLKLVVRMRPDWIYINAMPKGINWEDWKPASGGTKAPVTEDSYAEALRGHYAVRHTYDTDYFFRANEYRSYVFEAFTR